MKLCLWRFRMRAKELQRRGWRKSSRVGQEWAFPECENDCGSLGGNYRLHLGRATRVSVSIPVVNTFYGEWGGDGSHGCLIPSGCEREFKIERKWNSHPLSHKARKKGGAPRAPAPLAPRRFLPFQLFF